MIANRGEIPIRVIRARRDLGYTSLAVYSDAEAQSERVQLADESIRVGDTPAAQSYLAQDRLIAAAVEARADTIHPGCGFLSENPDFAERVVSAGPAGRPPDSVIRRMGDKMAVTVRVPLVPGTDVIERVEGALAAGRSSAIHCW